MHLSWALAVYELARSESGADSDEQVRDLVVSFVLSIKGRPQRVDTGFYIRVNDGIQAETS